MRFNCLKAAATSRRQFTFYHSVPRNSWYSFYRPRKDERLSRPWSHPVVLNTGPLDWESSALTTWPLLHKDWFYLGQTISLKQRIRKHKSDVFHPQNSFCKQCSEHLHDCSKMKEPFFRIYPFLYEKKKELCKFKEKRFIMRWKPQLNTYK